ncbi:hypothetical protein EC968_003783 [Mortierella alpina]|nr:hypothetical protein EC968_003783 [Mortierella alpina]
MFVRPAAAGERVSPGQMQLGDVSGGSVSEPTLSLAVNGSTGAPSLPHNQAHLVHFSKEGQGAISSSHEATTIESSAAQSVDATNPVKVSSCNKTGTGEEGSVETVVGVCFDMIQPPPPPPPSSPAVQSKESGLGTNDTVVVSHIPPIITTTLPSPTIPTFGGDSSKNVKPAIIDLTASSVPPPHLQEALHDAVVSSGDESCLNDDIISLYLPSSPVPQRQRSLSGLPIARRHRALPIPDLDLSASRPVTPLAYSTCNSNSDNTNTNTNRSRGDSLHADRRNFSLPILLHSRSALSKPLQDEGINIGVQYWRKPAALKEKLEHITTIEELEEYALCGETIPSDVGPPPVIRAPGYGLHREQAGQPLMMTTTTTTTTTTMADEIEVGESSCSNTTGGIEGGRSRQSVRSLESRIEMLREFPVPPAVVVVVEAADQEKSQGDSGSGLGL